MNDIEIRERLARIEAIIKERDKRWSERIRSLEQTFLDARVSDQKALSAALAAAEKAVEKAEASQLRVNLTQNEFRGTLADQNALVERTMMPRAETELLVKDLRGRIDDLAGTRREGQRENTDLLAKFLPIVLAAIAIAVTLIYATH